MPTTPTAYRVFIASPSGLDDERRTFHETIHKYNEADGYARNTIFVPVGWEETLGGRRRPQTAINEELDSSDYFVLVLSDRWGTPPDETGKYTSGTEEEFDRAKKLAKKKKLREIVVFFKAVDPKQLSDPGDQLKKVLEFKKKLEATKEIFFHTFDDTGNFQDRLNKFLHKWVRDDEDGKKSKKKPRSPKGGGDVLAPKDSLAPPPQPPPSADIEKMLDQAEALADKGKLTEAEVLFSRAIIKSHVPSALDRYGRFLRRLGRMSQAIEMHKQALAIARKMGDRRHECDSLGSLGLSYYNLGEPRKAIEFHEQRLAITREIGDSIGEGNALGDLGIVYAGLGETRKAMDFFQKQLENVSKNGNRRGESNALCNLGNAHIVLGDARKAIELYEQQLKITREIGDRQGEGSAIGNLGVAYKDLGETRKAIELYEQYLAISREIGDRRGQCNALCNLGNAYAALGEARKAMESYEKQLEIARDIGDRRGEGRALYNSAMMLQKLGQKTEAIARVGSALAIFETTEDPNATMVRAKLAEWRKK